MYIVKLLTPLLVILISCSEAKMVLPVKTGHEGQGIPQLSLLLMDKKTYYNTSALPKDRSNVLFYFSPTCPHCRVQMRTIVSNMNRLKDVQFTILTIANYDDTKHFYDRYGLNKYPNVVFGIDTGFVFPRFFNTNAVPFTAIYNSSGALEDAYTGSLGIKQLKEVTFSKTRSKELTEYKSLAQYK